MIPLLLLISCARPGTGEAPQPVAAPAPAAAAPTPSPLRADPGARVVLHDGEWCAVPSTGAVRCGRVAGPEGVLRPETDTALLDARALVVFDDSLISLHGDGTLRATRMFGSSPAPALPAGRFGALPRASRDGGCALTVEGEPACWARSSSSAGAPPAGPFDALVADSGGTCGLRPSGELACWSIYTDNPLWAQLPADGRWSSVAFGGNSLCATSTVTRCWGRLASPPGEVALRHLSVNPGEPDAPADRESACGINSEGALSCWGNAGAPPEGRFVDVAVGDVFTCALGEDDGVRCWRHPLDYPSEPPGDGD